MKKETLLLHHIMQDLKIVARFQMSNTADWRFSFIVPVTLLSVIFGWLFENIWIGLFIFSVAAYHIVRYVVECKEYYVSPKGLENISIEGDEFYYISLQGYPDVAYIYPCKNFILDEKLMKQKQTV